jgi:hypothetical protein
MIAKPDIHPLAAQHLRELRDRGIAPSDDEIMWIVALCEKVLRPDGGDRADLCGFPVRVGSSDIYLRPLTIGAAVWLHDRAEAWYGGDGGRHLYAIAWALAHGRDAAAMRAASLSRGEADRIITAWCAGLTCTLAELEAAIDRLMPANAGEPQNAENPDPDWPGIIADIESATGIETDHWLWDVSMAATVRAWIAARSRLVQMAGGSPPHFDALNDALAALARAKAQIIAEAQIEQ